MTIMIRPVREPSPAQSRHRNMPFGTAAAQGSRTEAPAGRATDDSHLDACIARLSLGSRRLAKLSIADRISLLEQCVDGIASVAREWVDLGCHAKGIPSGSTARAEEVAGGPLAAMRQLQLFLHTMRDIEATGQPRVEHAVRTRADGRVGIRVTPCRGFFDPYVFMGFKATAWLDSRVEPHNVRDWLAPAWRSPESTGTSLVLGAGNVGGIPAADVLSKLCVDNRTVLLKMNPVNEYLGPVFERAFAPLVENDLLRIAYGGAAVGARAIADERITDIHVTGSTETHDSIVWGPPGPERTRRQQSGTPLLQKPITSELGNVTPWIIVPGAYSPSQLRFQAGNIVSSLTNNAAFNCIATRVLVTWKQWRDREKFLGLVQDGLARTPQRRAYYPGAADRFEQYTGHSPEAVQSLIRHSSSTGSARGSTTDADGTTLFAAGPDADERTLPWTLIRHVRPTSDSPLFSRESFVCASIEVAIDADSPEQFLDRAVEFCNEHLWGTLAVSLTVPSGFRRGRDRAAKFDAAIDRLRYGVISINQWAGLVFALMSPPWGAAPGATLDNIQSGTGWVHNSLMLSGIDRTVLEAPLTVLPKPVWQPDHRNPEAVTWALLDLMRRPTYGQLTQLTWHAVRTAMAGGL